MRTLTAHHPCQTNTIILCVVYHFPRSPSSKMLLAHLITTVDAFPNRYSGAKFVLSGNFLFNEPQISKVKDPLRLSKIVNFPTYKQNTVYISMMDLTGWYSAHISLPPMGRSNHKSILLVLHPIVVRRRELTLSLLSPSPDLKTRNFGQWVVGYP